ncbi:MAG: cytochrome P450 [Gammaproteobacteria bacterium]|nr:MAG: cytochrome P450 [Gammaproteobacteria bacterium]
MSKPEMAPGRQSGCPFSARARTFDPFGPAFQANPGDALRWARDEEPVFYSETMGYWVVSRYEDVKSVFRDPVLFSASIALEKVTPAPEEAGRILEHYGYALRRTMVNEDEPDHMLRRRLLIDAFLPANLERHTAMIRHLTTRRVDAFIARGRANLVEELFWEVPMEVALRFLGVDSNDIAELKSFSVAHTVNTWGKPKPEEQLHVAESVGRFWQASGRILEKMRRTKTGTGWMFDSIRQNALHPEIVTDSYLHSMMMAILVAAHETTAHASANAVRALLFDPTAWKEIVANPGLIPNAVEECLRIAGSVVAWRRIATSDAVVGGVAIPKGGRILVVQASANTDERHFERPEELDLYRENASDHLTFGYGAHQCMGKNIARLEMRIFIEELSRRLPELRLAEQSFTYVPNISFRGPSELWVEWDADATRARAIPSAAARDFPIGPPERSEIQRRLMVAEAISEGGRILHLKLVDPDGRRLPEWSAGSHVDLVADGYTRKYSLCGGAGDEGSFRVAIQLEPQGRGGSRHFHDKMRVGQILLAAGPRNHFRLDETAGCYLLIAGGIGITPILAMADRLKASGKSYRLLYAGRHRDAMAFVDRVSRDHADAAEIFVGEDGRRMDLSAELRQFPDEGRIYACGPDRLLAALHELGAKGPPGWLTTESFSGTDTALDPAREHAFTVHLADSGRDITVAADKTVLDALAEAGIDMPCDCREGLCGSCEATVIEGGIDHRDKVLSPAERTGGTRMMTCCSRAQGDRLVLGL